MKRKEGIIAAAAIAVLVISLGAFAEEGDMPRVGKLPARRVLFLGNSITLHGPARNIGWTGNWGMAATEAKLDYVHRLADRIAKTAGKVPETKVVNIADFERGYSDYDIPVKLKAELAFSADIVIVALGENVAELGTPEAKQRFAAAFGKLLQSLRSHGSPALFVRSSFWPNAGKDAIMKKACEDAGETFIDISDLAKDEKNFARSERKIDHAGVAAHPGNQGMQRVADAIWEAMVKRAEGK